MKHIIKPSEKQKSFYGFKVFSSFQIPISVPFSPVLFILNVMQTVVSTVTCTEEKCTGINIVATFLICANNKYISLNILISLGQL